MHAAQDSRAWQPRQQLLLWQRGIHAEQQRQLAGAASHPLRAAAGFLAAPALPWVLRAVLLHCCSSGGSGAAQQAALAAATLLGAALDVLLGAAAPAGSLENLRQAAADREGRPGLARLLQMLAGRAPLTPGGEVLHVGWDLADCAAALAERTEALLPQLAHAGAANEAGQQAAAAAEAGGTAARRQAARARQQEMLARMRAQQARAAAAHEVQEAATAARREAEPRQQDGMDAEAQAAPAPEQQLPPHHPAAWGSAAHGACALCHCGADGGPLAWAVRLSRASLWWT